MILGETGMTLTAHLERVAANEPGPQVYLGKLSVNGAEATHYQDDIHPLEYDPKIEGSLGLADREDFFAFLRATDVPLSQQITAWSSLIRQSTGYAMALRQWNSSDFLEAQLGRMHDMVARTKSGHRKERVGGFIQQIEALVAGTAVGVPTCYGSPVAEPYMVEFVEGSDETTPVTVFDNGSRERAHLDLDSLLSFFQTLHGPDRAMSLTRQQMIVAFLDSKITAARASSESQVAADAAKTTS